MKQFRIGQRVFVEKDNYGERAVIIEEREGKNSLAPDSHWKVRGESGQEYWVFDFELREDETQ